MICFKEKTTYGMRISEWSSDVCSSDLDRVRVLLVRTERVEDNERVVVDVLAVEQPARHGEVARPERDHRRDARSVKVAAATEVVLARRQAGEQARQHLVERRTRSGHHPAEHALDARRRIVQFPGRASVQTE